MAKAAFAHRLLLAIGVIAAPIAASGASEPAAKGADDYYTKKVCDTIRPTGSRLGGTRRCRSRAETDQARRESRQVIERIQNFQTSFCPSEPLC